MFNSFKIIVFVFILKKCICIEENYNDLHKKVSWSRLGTKKKNLSYFFCFVLIRKSFFVIWFSPSDEEGLTKLREKKTFSHGQILRK